MEITKVDKDSFRIKGKDILVTVSPNEVAIGDSFVITNPGEYEVAEVRVYAYDYKKGVVYHLTIDGINLVYLDETNTELSRELIEELNTVNILFIKAGNATENIVSQLAPDIALPFGGDIEKFIKEMGEEKVEHLEKLKVTSFDEESEETKVVILGL